MDCPAPVDPSPNAQLKVYGAVPPVADPANVTCWPTWGEEGEYVKLAPSAAATVIVWLDVAFAPLASVAVTVTLNEPEVE